MNKLEKLRMMIRLALIDEKFESKEREVIVELAKMEGVSDSDLEEILEDELSTKESRPFVSQNMDFASKVEVLADLVRVMKVDGEVYLSEIKFCEMIANLFGFSDKSISFLSKRIHADAGIAPNWDFIQSGMKKYVA